MEPLISQDLPQTSNRNSLSAQDSASDFLKYLKLDQLNIELDLAATPVALKVDLSRLDLPRPYQKITNLKITCPDLIIENRLISCQKGQLLFKGLFGPELSNIPFSLTYNALTSELKFSLENIKPGMGKIALQAQINEHKWQSNLIVSNVQFNDLKPYLHHYLFKNTTINEELLNNTEGVLNFTANASGFIASSANQNTAWIQSGNLTGRLNQVQYQYDENMADQLSLRIKVDLIQALKNSSLVLPSNIYQIAVEIDKVKGEIFQNDMYIVPNGDEKITTRFAFFSNDQTINFSHFNFTSQNIVDLKSSGKIDLNQGLKFVTVDAEIDFFDLDRSNQVYLTNIFADTDNEGLKFKGAFKGAIHKNKENLELNAHFIQFNAAFNDQFSLNDLNGTIYWNNYNQNKLPVIPSQLSWQELTLNQLPMNQVKLNFITHHDYLKLEKEVDIPLFDGALHLNNFEITQFFEHMPENYQLNNKSLSPDNGLTLTMDGFIKPISLELLSSHFDWPLLDGHLSGVIPSTTYNEKFLKVGGAIMLQVFDGTIIVKDLNIIEPLKDYAQLTANIDFNNLNLKSLTKTYNFGEIRGRVEGKLSQLELSAWQPIAFDAYIKTPENDKSSHKISQRAIDNLSSLGGASGLLSRSFLSFFETFRYDKLGLSCKLKNNTCLMSGVEAKGNAYYIVKGGGIPRIDVMGYQRKVNWHVLISRLKAIQQANEAVIQ
ncbi:MAG: hypothetical protein KZQ64_03755 [gamma proteobacterium symbiont of Bathyaustriella thionipta]|nr:hypothetical protein [gamma proteobacterium symbiont of Bathyaustriella thionipta]